MDFKDHVQPCDLGDEAVVAELIDEHRGVGMRIPLLKNLLWWRVKKSFPFLFVLPSRLINSFGDTI